MIRLNYKINFELWLNLLINTCLISAIRLLKIAYDIILFVINSQLNHVIRLLVYFVHKSVETKSVRDYIGIN